MVLRLSLVASLALLVGCGPFSHHLDYRTQISHAMGGLEMEYAVFTPPVAPSAGPPPLVVFLHGGGDSHDAFDRHGIAPRIEAAMREGRVPPAVIVLPNGHLGLWANWYDGSRRYEDWIVDELMPRVARQHGTGACPEACHIMGVSMGGVGALRVAHHRSERFATVAAISGPVMRTAEMRDFLDDRLMSILMPTHRIFGPPEPISRIERDDLFLQWTSPEAVGLDRVFVAWASGDREAIVEGSRALAAHLEANDIAHEAREFEGRHAWVSWGPVIEQALAYALR